MVGLSRAAAVVLGLYAVVRLGDLAYHGKLGFIAEGTWDSALFVSEIMLSTLVPFVIFAVPSLRKRRGLLTAGAAMVVFGFVLNRIDASGLATVSSTGTRYFPSWMEFSISIGIVSAAALVFFFFVERFQVYEPVEVEVDEYAVPAPDPVSGVRLMSPWMGPTRQYSLVFILAIGLGFLILPEAAIKGAKPELTPAADARLTTAVALNQTGTSVKRLSLIDPANKSIPAGGEIVDALLIDGNRDGRAVLFNHKGHQNNMGNQESCNSCHHMNKPFSEATPCYQCHSDMYMSSDIFDHNYHADKLGGNPGCVNCHPDPAQAKNRNTTTQCVKCHQRMRVPESLVNVSDDDMQNKFAASYMDAMHGLCISCHKDTLKEIPELGEDFTRCATCHAGVDMDKFRSMEPYTLPKQTTRR